MTSSPFLRIRGSRSLRSRLALDRVRDQRGCLQGGPGQRRPLLGVRRCSEDQAPVRLTPCLRPEPRAGRPERRSHRVHDRPRATGADGEHLPDQLCWVRGLRDLGEFLRLIGATTDEIVACAPGPGRESARPRNRSGR
jgi:hypothetical protein